jgi:hypothetical protein
VTLQQDVDGSWTDLPTGPVSAVLLYVYPGQSRDATVTIPADAAPGQYRLQAELVRCDDPTEAPAFGPPDAMVVSTEITVG